MSFETYRKNLLELVSKKIEKGIKNDKEFGRVMKNHMFNLDGPKFLSQKLTESGKVLSVLFYGFTEVSNSFDNLQDSAVYVKQYPNYRSFQKRNITKSKYLRYHIEKYFEEMYIIKCRLESYAARLKRYFRHSPATLNKFDALIKVVCDTLKGVIETRGAHTHVRRFTDQELDQLSTLEFMSTIMRRNKKIQRLFSLYKDKRVYPSLRNKWAKIIVKNNIVLKELLDTYFTILNDVIFCGNEQSAILKQFHRTVPPTKHTVPHIPDPLKQGGVS